MTSYFFWSPYKLHPSILEILGTQMLYILKESANHLENTTIMNDHTYYDWTAMCTMAEYETATRRDL